VGRKVNCAPTAESFLAVEGVLAELKEKAKVAFENSGCACGDAVIQHVTVVTGTGSSGHGMPGLPKRAERGKKSEKGFGGPGGVASFSGTWSLKGLPLTDAVYDAIDRTIGAGKTLISWPCQFDIKKCREMTVSQEHTMTLFCVDAPTSFWTPQPMFTLQWEETFTFTITVKLTLFFYKYMIFPAPFNPPSLFPWLDWSATPGAGQYSWPSVDEGGLNPIDGWIKTMQGEGSQRPIRSPTPDARLDMQQFGPETSEAQDSEPGPCPGPKDPSSGSCGCPQCSGE